MLVRRLAVAIGLLCGLIASQLPEFAQQYRQRLGGALDELNRTIAQFDSETAAQSLTREQGIDRLRRNPETLARERGAAIDKDINRANRLVRQQEAFQSGGPLTRLATLIGNFDPATATRAIENFEPAVPITVEAFMIASIAVVVGWGATHLCAWPIRRRWRARSLGHGERAA